jgi:hypothetical protein
MNKNCKAPNPRANWFGYQHTGHAALGACTMVRRRIPLVSITAAASKMCYCTSDTRRRRSPQPRGAARGNRMPCCQAALGAAGGQQQLMAGWHRAGRQQWQHASESIRGISICGMQREQDGSALGPSVAMGSRSWRLLMPRQPAPRGSGPHPELRLGEGAGARGAVNSSGGACRAGQARALGRIGLRLQLCHSAERHARGCLAPGKSPGAAAGAALGVRVVCWLRGLEQRRDGARVVRARGVERRATMDDGRLRRNSVIDRSSTGRARGPGGVARRG